MSCSVLHHVEVCVKDDKMIKLLTKGFGFTPFAHRVTPAASKLALRSGDSVFVIVKRNSPINRLQDQNGTSKVAEEEDYDGGLMNTSDSKDNNVDKDATNMLITEAKQMNHIDSFNVDANSKTYCQDDSEHWSVFCCEGAPTHTIDSVFNVALVVKDVDAVTQRVRSRGGQVLKEPLNLSDSTGHVRYSIVTSCCGNIVHTLIDKNNYSGSFLPGFESIDNHEGQMSIPDSIVNDFSNKQNSSFDHHLEPANCQNSVLQDGSHNLQLHKTEDCSILSPPISTHIDHVTYVCEIGKSKDLLSWYEYCFGMKRFMANRDESESEGFVLGDNIGLRLKAMEYWRCAETGLSSPNADISDSSLKLVIAEPLPDISTSHVDTFLRAHKGPGVQHIGLHSPTMVATVDFMAKNGVVFRKAPPVYYDEGIKLDEIKEAGHGDEVELFKELGILLDTEADVFTETEKDQDKKSYLMQVFTVPLFDEDTFFLEVIQRRGARGFGAGNIKALAKSIILHNQKLEDSKHHAH